MKYLAFKTPAGALWGIPVETIARHRAACYVDEFGNDIERSLAEDTMLLFESDPYEIQDWASNNMDWLDLSATAVELEAAPPLNMAEVWWDVQDKWVVER